MLVSAAPSSGHPFFAENLDPDPSSGERERQLRVPEGTTNIALGRPVTSMGLRPVAGELQMVTDGDKDSGEGSTVELPAGKQWVQIDLGESATIFAIIMWLGDIHRGPRAYHDVIVQVSDDAHFVYGVTTLFNNDRDNSSGLGLGSGYAYVECFTGKWIDAQGARARYVRVQTNGSTSGPENHFTEIEVWGTRGKPSERMVPLKTALPKPAFW